MKKPEVILYCSQGDGLCEDVRQMCLKKGLNYQFADFRDIILHEDEKKNRELLDRIEDIGLKKFPIISINGEIERYHSDFPEDIIHYIESKLKEGDKHAER